MEPLFSSEVKKELKKIKAKQPKLSKKIQNQLKIFTEDPKHPSLRLHKLKGHLNNAWSISIDENYRMLFYVTNGKAIFFKLGTHDQVYKK